MPGGAFWSFMVPCNICSGAIRFLWILFGETCLQYRAGRHNHRILTASVTVMVASIGSRSRCEVLFLFFCSYKCTVTVGSAEHQISELLIAYIVLHNWRKINIKYGIGYRNNIFICDVLKTCYERQHSHRS